MNLNKPMKLIFWIILFESIGFLLGLVTQANIYPWYEHLHKSSLTPPGFIFSVVWTLLYALLAVIAWLLSDRNKATPKKVIVFFTLQMLMNWVWTPLFFQLHWLRAGAIWLIALTCLNGVLLMITKDTNKTMIWLLAPYVLWLMFACYLNIVIALMN